MTQNENKTFTKDKYTLEDFALFKLCPALYAYSVVFPDKDYSTQEQKRLALETRILKNAFSSFASANEEKERLFFNSTRKCTVHIFDEINNECEKLYLTREISNTEELKTFLMSLYEKAEKIIIETHRWAKGTRYTIINGVEKEYDFNNFKFIYHSSFRAFDYDLKKYKTIYINEYETFPVFSAGSKDNDLFHYKDILNALSGNDSRTDRVGLVIKIIKKINGQLESTLYIDDGYERIEALAKEIQNYNFSKPDKKKSGFCRFCKFSDKCC